MASPYLEHCCFNKIFSRVPAVSEGVAMGALLLYQHGRVVSIFALQTRFTRTGFCMQDLVIFISAVSSFDCSPA
jgi:hypothetical protein